MPTVTTPTTNTPTTMAATVRKRCSPALLTSLPYSTRSHGVLRCSRLGARSTVLFSQLSGHNTADMAVRIAPRLFNDGEGLIDAPQAIQCLCPQHRDPLRSSMNA